MKHRKKMQFTDLRISVVLLVTCSLLTMLYPLSAAANDESDETAPVPYIIVSLGDSYASGEGVEPFYGQDLPFVQKVKNKDWIAHRSKNSWSGQLTVPYLSEPISSYKDEYWFFQAASGAKTAEILTDSYPKEYFIYEPRLQGTTTLPPQIEVFNDLPKGSVRYVTISIGGNDAEFSEVMKTVVTGTTKGGRYLNLNSVEVMINKYYENDYAKLREIMNKLEETYHKVSEAAGPQATILVAGYPTLLNEDGYAPIVSTKEARLVNDAVFFFNSCINHVVSVCNFFHKMNIKYVKVADKFEGHEAYTDVPYINPLWLHYANSQKNLFFEDFDQKEVYSRYSFHPNRDGIKKYKDCFQEVIDTLEKEKEQPEVDETNLILRNIEKQDGTVNSNYYYCPFIKNYQNGYPFIAIQTDDKMQGVLNSALIDLDNDGYEEKLVILMKEESDSVMNLYGRIIDYENGSNLDTEEFLLAENILPGMIDIGFGAFVKQSPKGMLIGGTTYSSPAGIFGDGQYTSTNVWQYKEGIVSELLSANGAGSYDHSPPGSNPDAVAAIELGFESGKFWNGITKYISSNEPDCRFLAVGNGGLDPDIRNDFYQHGYTPDYLISRNKGIPLEILLDTNDFKDWLNIFQ